MASDANDSYTYDKNGNLTSAVRNAGSGSTLYAWDYRNRLTDVTFKDGSGAVTGSIHYTYADNNNRISQVVKDASGTVTLTEFYIYDGSNLLLVLDGSGNVKQRYFNGPNENQVLAEETNIVSSGAGDTHWALTDHEGSVRDVIANSGSVLDHIQYDSFGNILSQSNAADAMRLAYTGQQYDSQTGLYYDHARYYDPTTGRFLSTDPAGFSAGDENLYRYVGNSPVDNTDPAGMTSMSDRWNTFWGNVGSFYHQAAPGVKWIANMDSYYNGTSQQRAATDAAAAQSWLGATALSFRNLNVGLWQLGETGTKAAGDAMIDSAAYMANEAGYSDLASDLFGSTTGTLDALPGVAQSWLEKQREDYAKRVQVQICAGNDPWEANALGTGLTFLNLLGIAPMAEGMMEYDLTNQKAIPVGQAKMWAIGGAIQFGTLLLPGAEEEGSAVARLEDEAIAPIKNISGDLGEAANAARNQPYFDATANQLPSDPLPGDVPQQTIPIDDTPQPGSNNPASRLYDRPQVETPSGKAVRAKDAVDDWNDFLGEGQTNIDPRDNLPDPDRIWSADGNRSVRFGDHEMDSSPNKFHYHLETWQTDHVHNLLQRVQK